MSELNPTDDYNEYYTKAYAIRARRDLERGYRSRGLDRLEKALRHMSEWANE